MKLRQVWAMQQRTGMRRSYVGVKQLAIVSAAIATVVLGGLYYLAEPDHKYRLTVELQTPQGLKSASGVVAVYKDKISVGGIGGGTATQGDALFLDLGGGRNLVAILRQGEKGGDVDGMNHLAMNAFAAAGQKVPFKGVKLLSGTVQVYGDLIPTLVTFANVADPKTARVIEPTNIEAAFGGGYHLKQVTLEMVPIGLWPLDFGGLLGEPVTRGIDKRLPWVNSLGGYLSGRFACNPSVEACLDVGQFRRR
jgi:hypothetical protein